MAGHSRRAGLQDEERSHSKQPWTLQVRAGARTHASTALQAGHRLAGRRQALCDASSQCCCRVRAAQSRRAPPGRPAPAAARRARAPGAFDGHVPGVQLAVAISALLWYSNHSQNGLDSDRSGSCFQHSEE